MSAMKIHRLQEISKDFSQIFKDLLDVLEDHEKRLQLAADLRPSLRTILREISCMVDPEKRDIAIGAFTELLDAFGVSGLAKGLEASLLELAAGAKEE